MKTIMLILMVCSLAACSEPVDPRTQFVLADAQQRWNTAGQQWPEKDLRVLEYGMSQYRSFCAACHLSSGEGQATMGAPALIENSFARGPVNDVTLKILLGKRGSSMPAFARSLDDEQVAAILSYVRNAWGEQSGELVSGEEVAAVRAQGKTS